jgi:hypothetical protein
MCAVTLPLAAADSFDITVQPFLAKTCYGCHNAQLQSGGLNLQQFTSAAAVAANRDRFLTILEKLKSEQMPPPGIPRPEAAAVTAAVHWIEGELDRLDRAAPPDPGRVTARRLNRTEYNYTVRDLLGVDFQPAADFPPDDSGYGFDNIGDVLSVSPALLEKYVSAAERIARAALYGPPALKPVMVRHEPWFIDFGDSREVKTAYDETGLSLPSALHVMHRFPVEGDYNLAGLLRGTRPDGSEPLQVAYWVDGKQVKVIDYPVPDGGEVSGVRREFRIHMTAGEHWLSASFLKIYEGLPASYNGLNPSKRPPRARPAGFVPAEVPANADPAAAAPAAPPGGGRGGAAGGRGGRGGRGGAGGLPRQATTAFMVSNLDVLGPYDQTTGASEESLRKIFVCGHLHGGHNPSCARRIVTGLARRTFRRSPTAPEVDQLLSLVALAQKQGDSFEEGIGLAVQKLLISPHFLFRIEQQPKPATGAATATAQPVSDYELATRLSYFLWSSTPDDELLRLAEERRLRRPEVLAAQLKRMMQDAKIQRFVENFGGQWLQFRALESHLPDRKKFQEYTDYTRMSMARETSLFFENLIHEDRPILDLLDAKYTFLNERMADFYGIPGVKGAEFRRVDLAGTPRAGILTQASVLTVSSYANRTSPVLRGKWVLENILNTPPPPPPANVPSLDEDAVGASASLREQMEKHRANAICASCHSRMDPLGFALENFDAIGRYRTKDGKFPIDASGRLPDGRTFAGADGLAAILRSDPAAFAQCVTEKMLTYALGRGLESYDRRTVKEIAAKLAASQYRFSSLVSGIVNSLPFQMERSTRGKA